MRQTHFLNLLTLFLLLTLSLSINACSDDEQQQQRNQQDERILNYETSVAFISSAGDTLSQIRAAVADDQASRTEGLMNVNSMPDDAGMIFIFEENRTRSFWMASTPLSLDLVFVNEDFEIVNIQRNASPFSQDNISSVSPAMYVVEVNAGYTLQHDISEGDSIAILD